MLASVSELRNYAAGDPVVQEGDCDSVEPLGREEKEGANRLMDMDGPVIFKEYLGNPSIGVPFHPCTPKRHVHAHGNGPHPSPSP